MSFTPLTSYQEDRFYAYWKQARTGYRLRQQYPIGRFYVDFVNTESRVVIEIDGHAHHSTRLQKAKDRERQMIIERHGWKVIRFPGSVTQNMPEVAVQETLAVIQSRLLP